FCLSKNNPEIYRRAAKKIGIKPEEIMFFDDNKISLETAKSAGMHTTGVFDETSSADEEIIRTSNDNYIKSFKDLL
ncbi:MAG: HAD-IA family hydrolase, partial [Clostridia bacterium]|nr:HAD-IA family hydrolase [Clostridia bacterium]